MTLIEQYRIINHFLDIIIFTLAKVNKKNKFTNFLLKKIKKIKEE